jgi:hypothetical protein
MCPIPMDLETGPFIHNKVMVPGYYCRPLSDYQTSLELHLRPTAYPGASAVGAEIMSEVVTNAVAIRKIELKRRYQTMHRSNAVCTVQTFRNSQTGPMLYFFVKFYQLMGWHVIVYDRFGLHQEFIRELLDLQGVDYYPYTIFQITQPKKYNDAYKEQMGTEYKAFYKMEVNWGYTKNKNLADTADQDADKSRTYDHARVEYSHLDMILYIDADELFYCPEASKSIETQRYYHQQLMDEFQAKGIEEMRFVRLPYSGM